MKRILNFIFIIIAIILFTNCKRDCMNSDQNKGIIIESKFFHVPENNPTEGIVISDTATFIQEFPLDTFSIDFSKYTLLGFFIQESDSRTSVTREVTILESEKQYHYKVTTFTCGIGHKLFVDWDWVTVPKLPDGWTVTFEKETK